MRLTWRAYAARYYAYLDTGESLCGRFYKLLVAGAALKILVPSVPLWAMLAASPLVVVFMAGILVWAWRNPEGEIEFGAAHGDPECLELLRRRPD